MKELNEMTIGRTDDPENPISVPAFEVAKLFGAGSRIPSGPADMVPRRQAGHMLAIDPPVKILFEALASKGPSTHTLSPARSICDGDDPEASVEPLSDTGRYFVRELVL